MFKTYYPPSPGGKGWGRGNNESLKFTVIPSPSPGPSRQGRGDICGNFWGFKTASKRSEKK